jgi:hypothetical protein
MSLRAAASLLVAGALVVACAEGADIGETGGAGGEGGVLTGAGVTNGPTTTAGSTTKASSTSSSSTGEGGDMATTTSSTGTGMMCDYDAPDTCATAEIMPAIAGDTGGPTVTRKGTTSKWYKVHIQEQDSGVFETDLSYTVTLISPPGMDYNLKVYQGPQDGSPDCNASPINGAGSPEVVSASWDDDQGIGGEDDSLWLNIEVVYVSGSACDQNAEWTLTVAGNT